MPLTKQGTFTFNHSDQPNDLYNVETSAQIKSNFDSRAQELANTMNAIIDQLKAITDGDSGADNVGATAITGLTGTTVQALLEALKTQIDNVTLGQIPDNSITKQKLAFNAADQNILSSTTTSEGASLVGIEDASAHFTSTNVEGALSELFQFANDGKTNIATVVGSPATISDTFSQLQTHIQDAKNSMATNLTNKGQSSTGTEALQALADKIANVSTGVKSASGTMTSSTNAELAISGLGFVPRFIIASLAATDATANFDVGTYTTLDAFPTYYNSASGHFYASRSYESSGTWSGTGKITTKPTAEPYMVQVSFPSKSYNWWAFE